MDSKQLSILIAFLGIGIIYMYWKFYTKNQLLEQQIYYLHNHIQQLTPMSTENEDKEQINYGYEEVSEEEEEEEEEEEGEGEEEPNGIEQYEETKGLMDIQEAKTPAEDIIITKTSHCQHILQSGKNKGSSCGKSTADNGYCKNHSTLVPEPLINDN